jgi:hypothetical protein
MKNSTQAARSVQSKRSVFQVLIGKKLTTFRPEIATAGDTEIEHDWKAPARMCAPALPV